MKRVIFAIMAFVGLFLLIGTVGKVEYMWEIGQNYPVKLVILQCVVGFILMFPAAFISR